jgi:hypothetical protein
MFKKISIYDILFFLAALFSLLYSEALYFLGHKQDATFMGLWVPSILGFGIYIKLISKEKND